MKKDETQCQDDGDQPSQIADDQRSAHPVHLSFVPVFRTDWLWQRSGLVILFDRHCLQRTSRQCISCGVEPLVLNQSKKPKNLLSEIENKMFSSRLKRGTKACEQKSSLEGDSAAENSKGGASLLDFFFLGGAMCHQRWSSKRGKS